MTRVRAVELRVVRIPLVRPFRTSFGVEDAKECVLARVETDDAHGWGECVASPVPGYSAEFNAGALEALRSFLVPALLAAGEVTTDDLDRVFGGVRGNPMAKATLVNAVLDAELRARGVSLATHLGAIIVYAGLLTPFSVYLLTSFFRAIPTALIDAASIDGAANHTVLLRIVLPLSAPAIVTLIVVNDEYVESQRL